MDFLKAFKLLDKEITVNIQGTIDNPLFQANQIGDLLELTNIRATILWENGKPLFRASEIGDILEIKKVRSSIISFDEDEKVARIMGGLGGPQETLFLTESGVYRIQI